MAKKAAKKELLDKASQIREALRNIDQQTGLRTVWMADSQAEAAEFFGVSVDTVANWAKRGMPGSRGTYRIDLIVQWLRRDGPWQQHAKPDPDPLLNDNGESAALERYRLAKAKHAELDLEERQGQLVDVTKHRSLLGRWSAILRRLGERLGKNHGPEALTSLNDALDECERIMEDFD